jgi:hypothetical protein
LIFRPDPHIIQSVTKQTLEKVARTINYGIDALGRSLAGLLLDLLKLNAVLVFLWYLWEFASEPWEIDGPPQVLIGVSGVIFLGFAVWILIVSFLDEWDTPKRTFQRTNGWLYPVLVVVPILAVALVHLLEPRHHFTSKLLFGTETQIERFYATLR